MKHSYILFFCPVFSETRATTLAVFTCFLGIKTRNIVMVFIETRGLFRPMFIDTWVTTLAVFPCFLGLAPGFNEAITGFKF